jgi:hypothetical protein
MILMIFDEGTSDKSKEVGFRAAIELGNGIRMIISEVG